MARGEKVLKYLTPNIPASELDRLARSFCIPNNAEWLGAFMGAIYPLTLESSWEKHGSVSPAQSASVFQEIFDNAFYGIGDCMTSVCCPIRYGADGKIQQYDETTDTWADALAPLLPIRAPVVGQDTLCLASANATEVYLQTWLVTQSYYLMGASLLIALAGVISVLALAYYYPPAVPVVLTFFTELWGLMTSLGEDDFDSDKQEIFTCILFCNGFVHSDGAITYDYNAVLGDVDALWGVEDLNIWTMIHYLLLITGEDGLNRSATTTSIVESDCAGCTDCEWCQYWQFADSDGLWGANVNYSNAAEYVNGLGWRSMWTSPNNRLYIVRVFSDATVTYFEYTYNANAGGVSGSETYAQAWLGDSVVWTSSNIPLAAGTNTRSFDFPEGLVCDNMQVYVFSTFNLSNTVSSAKMRGTGTSPFGEDTC